MQTKILNALNEIEHPLYRRSLADLGLFARFEENENESTLFIKVPEHKRAVEIQLEANIRRKLSEFISGKFKIKFELDPSLHLEEAGNRIPNVKNIIAIGSGKGGVGKSTVSANLAAAMVQAGLKVGLMDADIYGPSIGKMFGMAGPAPVEGDGQNRIYPMEVDGIKLISFSFLMEENQAVIWRGPMLGKAIEQFLFQVAWGELDYLLIDLPPGTGDVQLSLSQLIDLDGAIIVTTPQHVALQDAKRAFAMFMQVKVPVLGVIENMSEFVCPHCHKVSHIFSKKGGEEFASANHIPRLGSIPLMQEIMQAGEDGKPVVLTNPDTPVAQAYRSILSGVIEEVQKYKLD